MYRLSPSGGNLVKTLTLDNNFGFKVTSAAAEPFDPFIARPRLSILEKLNLSLTASQTLKEVGAVRVQLTALQKYENYWAF